MEFGLGDLAPPVGVERLRGPCLDRVDIVREGAGQFGALLERLQRLPQSLVVVARFLIDRRPDRVATSAQPLNPEGDENFGGAVEERVPYGIADDLDAAQNLNASIACGLDRAPEFGRHPEPDEFRAGHRLVGLVVDDRLGVAPAAEVLARMPARRLLVPGEHPIVPRGVDGAHIPVVPRAPDVV